MDYLGSLRDKRKLLSGVVLSLMVFVGGCDDNLVAEREEEGLRKFGVEHVELAYKKNVSEGAVKEGKIHLFKLPAGKFSANLKYSDVPKLVSKWRENYEAEVGKKGEDSLFLAMNGAYFHEDYSPSGYLFVDGESVGDRTFDLDKSGLISFGESVGIHDLEGRKGLLGGEGFSGAIQSYPFYIKNGERAISQDSGLTGRRTALGVDVHGDVYVIFSPEPYLSLYEMMEMLDESSVEFENVLNLDGGPSSGISFSEGPEKRFDSVVPVPNVVIFEIRSS